MAVIDTKLERSVLPAQLECPAPGTAAATGRTSRDRTGLIMRRIREALVCAGLLAVAALLQACAGDETSGAEPDAPADAPVWDVAGEPDVSIGVVQGDDRYQMHQVFGAVRLPDGDIAVMNAGSGELRIYAPDGTFVSAHGRAGEGPGEFRGPSRMYLIRDTIIIHDSRLQRLSLHDLTGAFIENRPMPQTTGRFPPDNWLHDRSWIDGPPLGIGRASVIDAVARLPAPDSTELFRRVRVSSYGQLWVREPVEPDATVIGWRVYDMNAAEIGRVRLPARFEVLDYGPDYLLGRSQDNLDVEYVQLLRMDAPGAARHRIQFTASAADTMRDAVADSAFAPQRRVILGTLRMLNNYQEIYYSNPANNFTYATDLSQITSFEMPDGVDMRIVTANDRGWFTVAVDEASGRMCGLAIGGAAPPGWLPGVVACQ